MTTVAPWPNGVDVTRLVETVGAIQQNPALAEFKFRAHTDWEGGGRSRTSIQEFDHAGATDVSRTSAFELIGDEPPTLLGANAGPNAVEAALGALASCLAVGYSYNAAARGIEIRQLSFDVEGELDLRGFLGLDGTVRPGFKSINLKWRVDADASREQLEELCEHVQRTSPVLDLLRNPVPVSVDLVGRVVECPCGHLLRGANNSELFRLGREHADQHHPAEQHSDDEIRGIIAANARDE